MKKTFGFTLIELLVVMVIIGILVGILLPNLTGMRARARDTQVKTELGQLKTALQLYYSDFQRFPAAGGAEGRQMMGCGASGNQACTWGETFSATIDGSERIYMERLPNVNAANGVINYSQPTAPINDQTYLIWVTLENESDGDIEVSQERCNPDEVIVTTNSQIGPTYYLCP